jgi:CheY-like chemotaxis protein
MSEGNMSIGRIGYTILHVEPNDYDAMITERVLRDVASVRRVKTAIQAIDYLKSRGGRSLLPDLLLTNAFLPVLDGEMLLSWVRHQPELRHLKVFLQTDESDEPLTQHLLEAGADGVLEKKYYGAPVADWIRKSRPEAVPIRPLPALLAPRFGGARALETAGARQLIHRSKEH